jgi:predicted RNA-binding protein with TRAM domain
MFTEYEPKKPMVKEKEVVLLKLEGVGSKGDFYGKHKGLVIFVKGLKAAQVGEAISVEITKVQDRCAFGKKI